MTLGRAADVLSGRVPANSQEVQEARLTLALALVESYQVDIREWGLDKQGFCQGSFYRRYAELLGLTMFVGPRPPSASGPGVAE